jgi:hypothetical protein
LKKRIKRDNGKAQTRSAFGNPVGDFLKLGEKMNLVEIIESNVRKNPDKDCLRAGGNGYTFQEVKDEVEKAAALFQGFGLKKNAIVSPS